MFLSEKNLEQITKNKTSGTKLSIFLSTHPASSGPTLTEDTIRFKNSIQSVKSHKKYDERELGKVVEKLELLLDDLDFWKHRTLGVAVFADTDSYETVDLNYDIPDIQYVQDTFVVSPLVLMLSLGTGYYVLDINHTKPRLVHFTSHSYEVVATKTMPGSYEDTVGREEYQNQLQHQSISGNVFHGHDEAAAIDNDTQRYYKLIAKSVDEYLAGNNQPLILAGTEDRIGHMRSILGYPNIADETAVGNYQDLNEQELQDVFTTVIERVNAANRGKLVAKVRATPLSNLALGPTEIELANTEGRVETLFLPSFKRTTDNVRGGDDAYIVLQLPEDISAIESLVRGTLSQGGNVVAVEQGSFDNDDPRAICRF